MSYLLNTWVSRRSVAGGFGGSEPDIIVTINVTDTSEPTWICCTGVGYWPYYFEYFKVDGITIQPMNKYQFSTTGIHKLYIRLIDPSESRAVFAESGTNYVPIVNVFFSERVLAISNYSFIGQNYNSTPFTIVFPEGLESIGDQAFRLASVDLHELPSTLETIGMYAFSGCSFDYIHVKSHNLQLLGDEVFDTSQSYKIYVGDGISKADDDALLAQYLTDSRWAVYSSRLRTWYDHITYISFADPEAEAVCTQFFSSDGIGVTYEDAAGPYLTSPAGLFENNTNIETFDELQYFTGFSINTNYSRPTFGLFWHATNLRSAKLPPGFLIDGYVFGDCPNLEYVEATGELETVYADSFISNTKAGLTLVFRSNTPPSNLQNSFFWNINTTYIYVPYSVDHSILSAYQSAFSILNGYGNLIFYELCSDGSMPIIFTDAAIQQVCATEWGDGVNLSIAQAETVLTMEGLSGSSSATSFDELQYFTGLGTGTNRPEYCTVNLFFQIFPNVTSTVWPRIQYVSDGTFRGSAFTVVDLPDTVNYIGWLAFANASSLHTLVVRSITPPSIDAASIQGNDPNLKIYVPYSSDHIIIATYKNTPGWSSHASIIYELNPDGTIPA